MARHPVKLRKLKPGQRAKLADGRVLIVSAPIHGDVFAREYLGDEEWLPGRVGPKTGELMVCDGDQDVEVCG
jgi:hypothetical protein